MTIAIHITHEAAEKIGGIGTVLHGLFTSERYNKRFSKTLLYTPLFHPEGVLTRRLGGDSEVLYSIRDGLDKYNWAERFAEIEAKNGVNIIYGKKKFFDEHTKKAVSTNDIVAVDIWGMKSETVNSFKFSLWKYFGMQSDKYSHDRDFEQYTRIGAVLIDIAEALYGTKEDMVVFSHEYMGMPSALAFEIAKREGLRKNDKTIFYAHEVSTARPIVEGHDGHDISFYNVMNIDRDEGVSLEQEYGSFESYSRNELIKRATELDYIFAVSDLTKEEYLYLCPNANQDKIKVVYNGIPTETMPFSEKERSRKLIEDYSENLFNFRPDHIFTHVARLVPSKAIWRDIRLLYFLDEELAKAKRKGVYFLISTLIGSGRSNEDAAKMETEYGWPVLHREGWPDLVGPEVQIYRQLELFNARSKAIKGAFVNQFGFNSERCGARMPSGTTLLNLRLASDAEFGLSIYEPFGIAQLETTPYGGIPVISNACGCSYLLHNTVDREDFIEIDFTTVPRDLEDHFKTKDDFKKISKEMRDLIETECCRAGAKEIMLALPKTKEELKKKFQKMQKKSSLLDWEHVGTRIEKCISG